MRYRNSPLPRESHVNLKNNKEVGYPYPLFVFTHHPFRSSWYDKSKWVGVPHPLSIFAKILYTFLGIRSQHVKRGLTLSFSPFSRWQKRREERIFDDLTSFINVHDEGTSNEAGIEERMQLERTEVEDERVRRDPLMELMQMARK